VTQKESKLLKDIRLPFSSKKREQFKYLIAKRDTESLSKKEYEELLVLTEVFEKYELQRLKLLAKLADLKKISLPEIVNLYKLHPVVNNQ